MNGKGKRMATLMAKKLPMTHKWVCLEWQRREGFFCNDRVFSLCILVPTREPSWTEAWIGSCTQLVQTKWDWAVKLAALQPWIDWAKEKGLLTQLGCRGSESHMCQTSACLAFGFLFVVDSCCLFFAGRIAVSNTPGKWRQNRSLFDWSKAQIQKDG